MDDFTNTIISYIVEPNTDYAVFIDGDWGSGKTFFWKNVLKGKIGQTKSGVSTYWKTMYISLNGISSIEDIEKEMFLESYKILDPKAAEFVTELSKPVLFGSFWGFGLGDQAIDYGNLVDLKNYIICFDDLERVSMNILEVLGFINKLVEHGEAKVLVIGNEEEINHIFRTENYELKLLVANTHFEKTPAQNQGAKTDSIKKIEELADEIFDKNENFARVRDKVIGRVIKFDISSEDFISGIIDGYTDKKYSDFLRTNYLLIYRAFKNYGKKNLRVLKQALNRFHQVFLHCNKKKYQNEVCLKMLLMFLAFSFELSLREKLEKYEPIATKIDYPPYDIKSDEIVSKYYGEDIDLFCFSPAIFEYVIHGCLHKEKLDKEVGNKPEEIVDGLKKINGAYWALSDDEFKESCNEVYEQIKHGHVPYYLYPRLYLIYHKFNTYGLFNIDLDTLRFDFRSGLELASHRATYNETLNDYFIFDESDDPDFLNFKSRAQVINDQLGERQIRKNAHDLLELAENDFVRFCLLLYSEKEGFWSKPFFKYMDYGRIMRILDSQNNESLSLYLNAMQSRYKFEPEDLQRLFGEEKKNLSLLASEIYSNMMGRERTIHVFNLESIAKCIESVTSNL